MYQVALPLPEMFLLRLWRARVDRVPLGTVYTALGLGAVAAGLIALIRDKQISPGTGPGILFVVFLIGAALQVRRLRAARPIGRSILLCLLLGGGLGGCALAPADQEAIRRAWAERDAERAQECQRARGGFVAGACVFGGGS